MKNPYIRAAIDTVAFIVYVAAIYYGVQFTMDTAGDNGPLILAGVGSLFLLYIVYTVALARRKYQETLNAIKEAK